MTDRKEAGELDETLVREFWERRAKKGLSGSRVGLSNLEPDPALHERKVALERAVLDDYVAPRDGETMLDLGAGHGFWAMHFAHRVGCIDCVEYSPAMVEIAKEEIRLRGIDNVRYHCMPAQEYVAQARYDVALISGLLIYLGSSEVSRLLDHLSQMTVTGSRAVLRDGTSRSQTYLIDGKYSETLHDRYSACYRTADQYIDMFSMHGFRLVRHRDMFEPSEALNKWDETVLRVYEFRKGE